MIVVFGGIFAFDGFQIEPNFGIGFAAITPSGIWTRILTVAKPAQPCGTANTAL